MFQYKVVFITLIVNVIARNINPELKGDSKTSRKFTSEPEKISNGIVNDISICSGNELTSECEDMCINQELKPLCTLQNKGLCICEYPSQNNEALESRAIAIELETPHSNIGTNNEQKNVNTENKINIKSVTRSDDAYRNVKEQSVQSMNTADEIKSIDENNSQLKKKTPEKENTALIEVHPQPDVATLTHSGNKVAWTIEPFAWKKEKGKDITQENGSKMSGKEEITPNKKLINAEDENLIDLKEGTTAPGRTIEKKKLPEEISTPVHIKNAGTSTAENSNRNKEKINIKEDEPEIKKQEINQEKTLINSDAKSKSEVLGNNKNMKEETDDQLSNSIVIPPTANEDNELLKVFNKPEESHNISDEVSERPGRNKLIKSESELERYVSNQTFIITGVFMYFLLCIVFLYTHSYRKKKYVRLPLLQHQDETNEL